MSILLTACEAIADAICPAWRKEVASGDADMEFEGKQRYDRQTRTYVEVVPRPVSTVGWKMERDKGLVRSIIISSNYGYAWPYLPVTLKASIEYAIVVTLEPAHIPVPGRGPGSTIWNFETELRSLAMNNYLYPDQRVVVGTAAEVKKALEALKS